MTASIVLILFDRDVEAAVELYRATRPPIDERHHPVAVAYLLKRAEQDVERFRAYVARLDDVTAPRRRASRKDGTMKLRTALAALALILGLAACGGSTNQGTRDGSAYAKAFGQAVTKAFAPSKCEVAYQKTLAPYNTAVDDWNVVAAGGVPVAGTYAAAEGDDFASWAVRNHLPSVQPIDTCPAVKP